MKVKQAKQTVSEPDVGHGNAQDPVYDDFLSRLNARFAANVGTGPIFTTNATDLWEAYLKAMPAELRQFHTCHACRHFVQRFGHLVTIDETGKTAPAFWNLDDCPVEYQDAVAAIIKTVKKAKVNGVFLSSDRVWGLPETGVWHHLSIKSPPIFKHSILTAFQASAEKSEDVKTVITALTEYTQPVLESALTLLRSDALYRSEKVLGQAEWLLALHLARSGAYLTAKANVVWRAIAVAPAGFCHPRASMIGTLLDDIAAGLPFADVSRKFAAKMHPLSYQRPQAAPTAGAIAAAEKILEQLGAADALARRFARLDEVQAIWKPTPKREPTPIGGVFGHLKPKDSVLVPIITAPAQTMTWEKFQRTILGTAERIELFAEYGDHPWSAFVTAVNADAPPILQWDSEEARNPVSWYFWNGGSSAASFGLIAGQFHEVTAVTLKPSMWTGANDHQGAAVMFLVQGAKDSRMQGSALFSETLKSEFHGIRSVIEAYSRDAKIEGIEEASAAGIMVNKGSPWNVRLRVWVNGRSAEYRLDRWD